MPHSYALSNQADGEVKAIFKYSYLAFGADQAQLYLDGLERCFESLVDNPRLGRNCDDIRAGYFRLEYISHIIFYSLEPDTVFISRVIHKSMDVNVQLSEDGKP